MAVNIDPSFEKALYGLGYSKKIRRNYYGSIGRLHSIIEKINL